jgi:hypothetical protein
MTPPTSGGDSIAPISAWRRALRTMAIRSTLAPPLWSTSTGMLRSMSPLVSRKSASAMVSGMPNCCSNTESPSAPLSPS